MELGKYQGVLRNLKRTKGGLRTVVYDPSIDNTTVDFPDIEQPKMGFEDGGVVQRENFSNGTKYLGDGIYEVTLSDGTKSYFGRVMREGKYYKTIQNRDLNFVKRQLEEFKKLPKGKSIIESQGTKEKLLKDPKFKKTLKELDKEIKQIEKKGYYNIARVRDKYAKGLGYYQVEEIKKRLQNLTDKVHTVNPNLEKAMDEYVEITKKGPPKRGEVAKLIRKHNVSNTGTLYRGLRTVDLVKKQPVDSDLVKSTKARTLKKLQEEFTDLSYETTRGKYRIKGTIDPQNSINLSHLDDKYTQYVTANNLGYATSQINQELLKPFDEAIHKIYLERADLLDKKPVGYKAKVERLNKLGMGLAARSQGYKNFTVLQPDGTKSVFGIDPAKTIDPAGLIEEGKKLKDFSEIDKQLININKGSAFAQAQIPDEKVLDNLKIQSKKLEDALSKLSQGDAVQTISSLACPRFYADGGRVKFSKGGDCFLKGAEIINEAKAGNPSALQKVRKFLKTPAAKVGMGALVELGIEGLFAVEGFAEGRPVDQILGESILGLAGFGSTEEEQILKHADPKDIENVKAYQKKLANENKLSANVGFEKMAQPETGEESTEDFFTVESLRPAIDKQRKQLEKDFLDPNLDKEEEAYGRAYRNYVEANKERAEKQGFRKPFQFIQKEIYNPVGEKIMQAYEAVENLFAEGGRVGMSEGGDPKDKMKTPFDKPTVPIDPNQIPQVQNPGRRGFIKGVGFIGAGIAAFAAGLLRLGRKESAKKLVQKAATYGGRRIDGVPEIILDLITNIKTKGKIIDAPKPGSGPVVYRYDNYEYAEDVNGFTVSKINDQGDYGYSEEVFQFEKDLETGATFFDDVTVRPDGDGKLKDVEYGVDYDAYNEIADDLAKFNKLHPNDTTFRDKARKFIDEERLKNEGIEPKPGTELD